MKMHTELRIETPQEMPLADVAAALRSGVADQKRAERSLRVAETLAATGRLAATIAHEINNPLTAVTNLVYLANNTPELPAGAMQKLDLAQLELRRIGHIVKQTLAFHRESSTPADLNVAAVLESALARYENLIRESGIQLEKRIRFDGTMIGYHSDIVQVFSNLIANAVEAMPNGGRLIVHTYPAHDPGGHSGASIVIADTGPGISPDQRRAIFEPFFTTKGEKGTGLGLWVSRGIIKKYEGTIRVRSGVRPNHSWTAFRIFLPHAITTAGVEPKRRYERAA
jgi:signal transduction histidine kinase